jgi:rhamnogalacturonan endolyase
MERLGRGVVAVRSTSTDVFVGWRILGTDPSDVSFNVYRSTGGGVPVLLNAAPLSGPHALRGFHRGPFAVERLLRAADRFRRRGVTERRLHAAALAPVQQYLRVPLQVPPGGTTPAGESYTYSPNDVSPGDLDGDGEYELIVKWDPSNSKDNSQSGYTGPVYLDAYTLAGARLWRIDLGRNIRAGAHTTHSSSSTISTATAGRKWPARRPTARSTGTGHVLGDPAADWRNTAGYVLSGPEFLTVFDGLDGHALATAPYVVPRGTVGDWGDTYGNRVDRFLATIAYLDGQRPSLVMARGYYTRTVLAAWNWRNGTLSNVWTFDTGHTGTANPYAAWRGQGNHNLSVGDVDGDGRDEIMYGASAIDDDGTGLFSTGLAHGDAIHMSDMDPDRPGLEVFQPHESPSQYGPNALEFRDARTGALIFGVQGSGDIGRGLALDVDPRYRGYEMWGSGPTGGMYTSQLSTPNSLLGPRGVQISAGKPSINFGVWWDGDLLRELLDGTTISKWNWLAGNTTALLAPSGLSSNNAPRRRRTSAPTSSATGARK